MAVRTDAGDPMLQFRRPSGGDVTDQPGGEKTHGLIGAAADGRTMQGADTRPRLKKAERVLSETRIARSAASVHAGAATLQKGAGWQQTSIDCRSGWDGPKNARIG